MGVDEEMPFAAGSAVSYCTKQADENCEALAMPKPLTLKHMQDFPKMRVVRSLPLSSSSTPSAWLVSSIARIYNSDWVSEIHFSFAVFANSCRSLVE